MAEIIYNEQNIWEQVLYFLEKKDKAIENIFVDGENAFIYNDFYQWTERLEKALFADNRDIISNARKTVNKYSSDKWATKLVSMYKELNPEKKK